MDRRLFLDVNQWAAQTAGLHAFARALADWLWIVLLALVVVGTLLRARGTGDPGRVARALWAAGAGAVAYAAAGPLARAIGRQPPYAALPHVELLVHRAVGWSLPNVAAAVAAAVALACLLAGDRLVGGIALLCALLIAFVQVYVGASYVGDALAGLGFGVVIAVVGVLPASAVLRSLATTGVGRLASGARPGHTAHPAPAVSRKDLAWELAPADGSRQTEAGPAGRPVALGATGAVRVLEDRPVEPRGQKTTKISPQPTVTVHRPGE